MPIFPSFNPENEIMKLGPSIAFMLPPGDSCFAKTELEHAGTTQIQCNVKKMCPLEVTITSRSCCQQWCCSLNTSYCVKVNSKANLDHKTNSSI